MFLCLLVFQCMFSWFWVNVCFLCVSLFVLRASSFATNQFCVYLYICVCASLFFHCISLFLCWFVCVFCCACVFMCVYVCFCVCMGMFVCVFVYLCVCMFV